MFLHNSPFSGRSGAVYQDWASLGWRDDSKPKGKGLLTVGTRVDRIIISEIYLVSKKKKTRKKNKTKQKKPAPCISLY